MPMDGCFPVSEQRSLCPPNRYPYILQLSPASWSASEPPDRLVGEAAGLGRMISCSKQMAHFAQNGIFFFFFCPEWLDAASRRITKTHSGILVLHYYLRFTVWLHWLEVPHCWAQQLQTSTSTSPANNTPFNASGLFTVNVVDLYWLRCTISW